MSVMQRPGYANPSIKLYEDYNAWKEDRFVELAGTFIALTLRDGLYGRNEGILQIHDSKNLHTHLSGENIIQVSVANANTQNVQNRIYGCKHFSASVDQKGDNILDIELAPIHILENTKFSRCFFTDALESIKTMLNSIYKTRIEMMPAVVGTNIFVPRVPWVGQIGGYLEYVREIGMSVDSETHAFVWEDWNGLNITDWATILKQDPKYMAVGDINQIGSYVQQMDVPLAYNFNWLTKANQHTRKPMENVTIFSHSFNDKEIQKTVIGTGENSIVVSRSGGYNEMTYRNGYEEAFRLATMAQYDGYAECTLVGDFTLMPGQKIRFRDQKDQFKTDFFIDEVVHEISNITSNTHLYMFTNSKDVKPIELEKIKNEIPAIVTPSNSVTSEPVGDLGSAQWNLDRFAQVARQNAQGRKATGDCALYVRKALQAAQVKQFFSGGLGNANEIGPRLLSMGWVAVGQNSKDFKKGDIAIFMRTNTPSGQKYGHICMFDGSVWISDFIQTSVQPNSKDNLTYTLYRARYGYSAG